MGKAPGLVLAIDQGTSSTKCLLVGADGQVEARAAAAVEIAYPQPGWTEHDPEDIWTSVVAAANRCLDGHDPSQVAAVALSVQRESMTLWERSTGRPVGPLIGWQDQRTAQAAARLRLDGAANQVRGISGLPLDPMFSALKAQWLLDRYDPQRVRSSRGELCLGTVDSWLLYRLTGRHRIELGNASRTQLFDVRRRSWSEDLLKLFDVPASTLPELTSSACSFGLTGARGFPVVGAPIAAVLADSHAALFAHCEGKPGSIKATLGTGSSVMGVLPGADDVGSALCLTLAWDDGRPTYAAEGNIRASGAILVWLAGILGTDPGGILELAESASSEGVDLVPAFGGLGAPWWDDGAVAMLTGLTLGTQREQLARAAVEALVLQVSDVVAALARETGTTEPLFVDGGLTANDTLMQLLADVVARPVHRATTTELSALGAAYFAARSAGLWDFAHAGKPPHGYDIFLPRQEMAQERRERATRWHAAVARSRAVLPEPGDPPWGTSC